MYYCGMATLLQPQNNKNCMKNNGATTTTTTTGTASSAGQKLLLPHEIVQYGNSSNIVAGTIGNTTIIQQQSHLTMNIHNGAYNNLSSTSSTSGTTTTITPYHQLDNNHHNQQQIHNQLNTSNHLSQPQHQQQQFNNTTLRYFSQFSNNNNINSNNNNNINSQQNVLSTINNKLLPHQQQNHHSSHHQSQQFLPPTTFHQNNLTTSTVLTTSNNIKRFQDTENKLQQQHLNNGDCTEHKINGQIVEIKNENIITNSNNEIATGDEQQQSSIEQQETEPEPEIDIVINNVVCSFSVRCHLNLRDIALNGFNVEFRRENGMVTMKLRRPYTTASIWSSGRITCTGATSENQAKIAARRYARCLQKLGFNTRFNNYRVVNVLGTCSMPWAIKIVLFSEKFKKDASYEPELHPGVTYKLKYPKATLKIFSTGSITVTAASVANVQAAIEHIYPLVYEFRKKRSPQDLEALRIKQEAAAVKLMEFKYRYSHSSRPTKRKKSNDDNSDDEGHLNKNQPGKSFDEPTEVVDGGDNFDDIIEECISDDEME